MGNTTKNRPHRIIVVLKLPKRSADFIVRATAIRDAMAANSKVFPSPPVAMAVLTSHIDDLSAKQAATETRTKGAAATRDAAQKLVAVDLGSLKDYVGQVVNADPANAESIATEAGMAVRKAKNPAKPPLAAKSSSVGTVKLMAKAIKGGKSNEWQQSSDGGKTWMALPPSTRAATTVTGLQTATTVMFRHRVVTKAGAQDWSQPISAVVS